MAFGTNIRTWFEGTWHQGDVMVMRAADHGIWQGSSVFDGARWFEREEVAAMLARHHPDGLYTPPPIAIAHHIIRAFAEGEVPAF